MAAAMILSYVLRCCSGPQVKHCSLADDASRTISGSQQACRATHKIRNTGYNEKSYECHKFAVL
jgi:hypothetical protein